ncbi:class I SAM-dependent methyltransferase [Arenicella xantha]|nr:class I SAM-dependent methyltransferase [Arenicella xantha]
MTDVDAILLKQYFNQSLPVVDFGCGFGKHTLALSAFFNKVIGVDTSQVVIDKNNRNPMYSDIEFSQFDGVNVPEAVALHSKLGDCNVYVKGVLHQIQTRDREFVAQSLKTLLGHGGALFIHEVDRKFLNDLKNHKFSELPYKLRQTLAGNLLPLGIDQPEIEKLFLDDDRYELCDYGKRYIKTELHLKTGQNIYVPCLYFCIVKRCSD